MPRTALAADELVALAAVDSTNILGRTLLADGALGLVDEGGPRLAVICADAQSAGHGRLGRRWSDQAGSSLLATFVTALPRRLVTDPELNGWFTMVAGLASLDALNGALGECGVEPLGAHDGGLMLKWPNDIFHDGHKLGGILAELVELPDGVDRFRNPGDTAADAEPAVGVMFGIGINLALPAEALPTPISTSLQLLYQGLPDGRTVRDMVAARLAASLRRRLAALAADPSGELPRLLDETQRHCWTLGRLVEARFADGTTLRGRALSLNADASLTVEDESGAPHVVRTADVGVLA
ncbi:biotin--acetyl-CoA-carboxylase ligase [Bifidobacterium sp. ESL0763]|uniref:biotin--[acetyl-CoA-carboxylase] ligase n=1 Tax=Bifidobacterium sp. ESL0763 TaxID=2983227 RepID=UPI0023F69EF9|nr:biotin--acetyl-CoA-carboxylase ligase [Bifidobacterium sp. ESL0763]